MSHIDKAAANTAAILATLEYPNLYYCPRAKNSHRYGSKIPKIKTSYPPSKFEDMTIDHATLPKQLLAFIQTKPCMYNPHELINKLKTDRILQCIPIEYWIAGIVVFSGISIIHFIVMDHQIIYIIDLVNGCSTHEVVHHLVQKLKPAKLDVFPNKLELTLEDETLIRLVIKNKKTMSPHVKNRYDCEEIIFNGETILSSADALASIINGVIYKIPFGYEDPQFMLDTGFTTNSYKLDVIEEFKKRQCKPLIKLFIKYGFQFSNEAAWYLQPINEHIVCNRVINKRGEACKGFPSCGHSDFWLEKSSITLTTSAFDNIHLIPNGGVPESINDEYNPVYIETLDAECLDTSSNTVMRGQMKYYLGAYLKTEFFNGMSSIKFNKLYNIETILEPYKKDPATLLVNFPMYCIPYSHFREKEINKLFRVNKHTKQTIFINKGVSPAHQAPHPPSLLAQILLQSHLNQMLNNKEFHDKLVHMDEPCPLDDYLRVVNETQDKILKSIYLTTHISMNKLEETIRHQLPQFQIYKIINYFNIFHILTPYNFQLLTFEMIRTFLNYLDEYINPKTLNQALFKLIYDVLNCLIKHNCNASNYNELETIYKLYNKLEEYSNFIYENNIPMYINNNIYYRKWKEGDTSRFIIIKC